MKQQFFQYSAIFFVVFLSLMTYFFLSLIFLRDVERIFLEKKVDVFGNLRNIVFSYLRLSLRFASTKNLREDYHTWIYNGFNPPKFDYIRSCKENDTRETLNEYISNFFVSLPIFINISHVGQCKWIIEESNILIGKHDEGDFFVNCSEVKLVISSNDTFLFDRFSLIDYISNNRYWYLYRKIYAWARDNFPKFLECMCRTVASCSGCDEIKSCYDELYLNLKNQFIEDKYINVSLEFHKPCCYRESLDSCSGERKCHYWVGKNCILKKDYECSRSFSSLKNLSSTFSIQTNKTFSLQEKDKTRFSIEVCKWLENRIETSMIYKIEDHKFFESTPRGPEKISISVGVYLGLRAPKSCSKDFLCFYSSSNAFCENCNDENICRICRLNFVFCEELPCYTPPRHLTCFNCKTRQRNSTSFEVEFCEYCEIKKIHCQ